MSDGRSEDIGINCRNPSEEWCHPPHVERKSAHAVTNIDLSHIFVVAPRACGEHVRKRYLIHQESPDQISLHYIKTIFMRTNAIDVDLISTTTTKKNIIC